MRTVPLQLQTSKATRVLETVMPAYLKWGPRLMAGAKGLSVTMVVPVPVAWTGIM